MSITNRRARSCWRKSFFATDVHAASLSVNFGRTENRGSESPVANGTFAQHFRRDVVSHVWLPAARSQ